MKLSHWLWGLLVLFGLVILSAVTVVVLAVEKRPLIFGQAELSADNIFRAKKLLDENNPRTLQTGEVHEVVVEQDDLSIALQYAASRVKGLGVELVVHDHSASLRATIPLPSNPLGQFLNVRAILIETGRVPKFGSLRIGRANLPGFLGDWLLDWGLQNLQGEASGPRYTDLLKKLSFEEGRLAVTYEWNSEVAKQLKSALVPADEQSRWKAAQEHLAEVISALRDKPSVPLLSLLGPMLSFAKTQSVDTDPRLANRAVMVVLGAYLVGKGLDLLVPDAKTWAVPQRVVVTLGGRDDFPKHFMISAAMAASAGSSFADAVGIYKEIKDSRGGSGFSFNDIAADRAGTRLGETSVANENEARGVQASMANAREADLFPEWKDLPEFMPEDEFKARFGGVGEPEYLKMTTEIERRINSLAFYRPPGSP